jgi:D-tyrosyl-tRNA(Tyr) deacylase
MPPQQAQVLYSSFVDLVKAELGQADMVKDGKFGAMMDVSLINDGPVTMQVA